MLNKIKLLMADGKRNALVATAKNFVENYTKYFRESDSLVKYYLILGPLLNIFLFSSLFSFIIIMISNFAIFRIVSNQK